MFAQANSEHCRHKVFNASWTIDGVAQDRSLFAMIRNTHNLAPGGTEIAYSDNAAILTGGDAERFYPTPTASTMRIATARTTSPRSRPTNHPTAIAPFAGAATGAGGGSATKARRAVAPCPRPGSPGLPRPTWCLPGLPQPWGGRDGKRVGKPARISSALDIMIQGPIGGAAFNDEFTPKPRWLFPHLRATGGRYGLRLSQADHDRPVASARCRMPTCTRLPFPAGTLLIQLGGEGMRIGMGGGAASSMTTGQKHGRS